MANNRERERAALPSSSGFERRTCSSMHRLADPDHPPQGGAGVPPKPSTGPAPSENQPQKAGQ